MRIRKEVIVVDGEEVEVVKKSNTKNIYLRVVKDTGIIRVSVPYRTNNKYVEKIVREHTEKIRRIKEQCAVYKYVTGEVHMLWGEKYILRIEKGSTRSVRLFGDEIVMTVREGTDEEKRKKILQDFYRKELGKKIDELYPVCEDITGVSALEYRIRDMYTRWGTCNIKDRRIWISLRLAQRPKECLKYVLMHELTHLLERNHTKRFYDLLHRFCPDWKNIEKDLHY